jgi:hypothetical protein
MWINPTIGKQRKALKALLEPAMLDLSKFCVVSWSDVERLDEALSTHFASIPYCHLVYAVDKFGKQVSSNISAYGIDRSYCHQDLSKRPYSVSLYPNKRDFMLSSVYISRNSGRPCISAVHPVIDDSLQFLGFVVADFDLRRLPLSVTHSDSSSLEKVGKYNIPFMPSQQGRVIGPFDKSSSDLHGILNKLISKHGVFHCVLHFSSGMAQLWQMDDPYQYRLYKVEQLLDPDMYLSYPRRTYPAKALVSTEQVQRVLERFCLLRLVDDKIYLRSGSVNIMNGLVSLSFSFEGSQYLPAEEFLSKDLSCWFEKNTVRVNGYNHGIVGKGQFPMITENFKNSFSPVWA